MINKIKRNSIGKTTNNIIIIIVVINWGTSTIHVKSTLLKIKSTHTHTHTQTRRRTSKKQKQDDEMKMDKTISEMALNAQFSIHFHRNFSFQFVTQTLL